MSTVSSLAASSKQGDTRNEENHRQSRVRILGKRHGFRFPSHANSLVENSQDLYSDSRDLYCWVSTSAEMWRSEDHVRGLTEFRNSYLKRRIEMLEDNREIGDENGHW